MSALIRHVTGAIIDNGTVGPDVGAGRLSLIYQLSKKDDGRLSRCVRFRSRVDAGVVAAGLAAYGVLQLFFVRYRTVKV